MPPGVLTRVLFVDAGATTSSPDGSFDKPYPTIQAAVTRVTVSPPATVAESASDWTILIAPGDYNESVLIDGRVRLALLGLGGGFRLGSYQTVETGGTNLLASGTIQNLTWRYNYSAEAKGFAAPQLVIGMVGGTDEIRHSKAISNRISGSIVVEGSGWTAANLPRGGTAFLSISHTQVDAGIVPTTNSLGETVGSPPSQPALDATAFTGFLVDRHYNSRFRGNNLGAQNEVKETPPSYILATSFMSLYEGEVRITEYDSIQQAGFAKGLTVSLPPDLGNLKSVVPPGIVNSTFAGTFTGPPKSLLLDAATNTWFIRNGATLAGGATKTFLDGPSPTILGVTESRRLHVEDCGATVLVNVRDQMLIVSLPQAAGRDDLTFTIKNITRASAANPITTKEQIVSVVPEAGETIDGRINLFLSPCLSSFFESTEVWSAVKLVAHRGNWWVVARG